MSKTTPSCDYLLITGRRRPCPPGEGCTEHTAIKKPTEHPTEIDVVSGLPIMRRRQKKKRGYTFDTEKAHELYRQGLTDNAIGEACGVSANSIFNWRKNNNLPANKRTAADDGNRRTFDTKLARELYDANCSDKEIAAKLGVSAWSIGDWRRSEGLPPNPRQAQDDKEQNNISAEPPLHLSARPTEQAPEIVATPPAKKYLSLGDFAKAISMLAETYVNADFEISADAKNRQYIEVSATLRLTPECAVKYVVINLH